VDITFAPMAALRKEMNEKKMKLTSEHTNEKVEKLSIESRKRARKDKANVSNESMLRNANSAICGQNKPECRIILVIPRVPNNFEERADSARLQKLRSATFGTGPCWEDVDTAHWYQMGEDQEMANKTMLATVESLTEEQYRRFSKVVVPSANGMYDGFSGGEMPLLEWIKSTFSNYPAVAQYWRRNLSQNDS